ncbi:MAG: hypothetical protein M1834_007636 [Cirrosporium novae-zelandiae]|nr:MAG: hypothetical protein M1834_007636 [Cirrosporium novae-zelandiae]
MEPLSERRESSKSKSARRGPWKASSTKRASSKAKSAKGTEWKMTKEQENAIAQSKEAAYNIMKQIIVTGIQGHPEWEFEQVNVKGDGNCLSRAFAVGYYGDENAWEDVKGPASEFWNNVMYGPKNSPHARKRRQDYEKLNAPRSDHNIILEKQLNTNGAYCDTDVLHVVADAFQVEIFLHTWVSEDVKYTDYYGNSTRELSRHYMRPQIHIGFYNNRQHYVSLLPPADEMYIAHLVEESPTSPIHNAKPLHSPLYLETPYGNPPKTRKRNPALHNDEPNMLKAGGFNRSRAA